MTATNYPYHARTITANTAVQLDTPVYKAGDENHTRMILAELQEVRDLVASIHAVHLRCEGRVARLDREVKRLYMMLDTCFVVGKIIPLILITLVPLSEGFQSVAETKGGELRPPGCRIRNRNHWERFLGFLARAHDACH